jgi:starch synthase (maltosyl-transferring)
MRGSDEFFSPRIFYPDRMTGEAVRGSAAAGFTHVMAKLAAVEDPGLPGMVALTREAGVDLLVDIVLDRVATGDTRADPALFVAPDREALLDPRRGVDASVRLARLGDENDARRLGQWWAAQMHAHCRAGVAGFRLLGLASCPAPQLASLLAPIREAIPEGLLLGWMPGTDAAQAEALRDTGLDGVFGSLPWWDFRASWFWDELARLRRVAPVIGAAAAPGGPHALPGPGDALAALLGSGWMECGGDSGGHSGLNAMIASGVLSGLAGTPRPLTGAGAPVLALLRYDAQDLRQAARAALVLVSTDTTQSRGIDPAEFLPGTGGRFPVFQQHYPEAAGTLLPGVALRLAAGEVRVYRAEAAVPNAARAAISAAGAKAAAAWPRLAIEAVTPAVDGGAFPVKRTAGECVQVQADVIFDGHDKIAAALQWRDPAREIWHETPMRDTGNDRWQAEFPLPGIGRHTYRVCAWRDRFGSFRDEVAKKHMAGVDTSLECIEGEALLRAAAGRATGEVKTALTAALRKAAGGDTDTKRDVLLSDELCVLMAQADDRVASVTSADMPVDAERLGARFASWYEVFPRSLSGDPDRHGTFADVIHHLPRIRDMGFDVLYFPPIHPIGRTNRKGPNNSLTPGPNDPGSPYAIGAAEGGHDALHPELGGFEDFQALRREAAAHGLELALDFAVQCAPDHPWLKAHSGWFDWRPDGSIKYAENPPKKYQDIVNVDFYGKDAIPGLWLELCRIVLFWAEQGVRLFRVDNPHTKPLPFWQWMIGEVRARHPDAVFLAEAFTRPKVMYRLAKIGFSQSYTYFTWRNTKQELTAYFTELADMAPRDFFRPHLFVNTPDINPVFLQISGRAGFLIRAALAATLSGLWGVYNGFELCESAALPGREEYLDSEKYQLRQWDWDRPGNIVAEVTALNHVRRLNPALQTHLGVTFLNAFNDFVLYYEKATEDRSNVVLVAISLDPVQAQDSPIELPLWRWDLPDDAALAVDDLISGQSWTWRGKTQQLRLTPDHPFLICRVRPV